MRKVCSFKSEYFARKPTPEVCLRVPEAAEDRLRPLFRGMCVSVGLQENAKLICVGYNSKFNLRKSDFNLRKWNLNLRKKGFNLRKMGLNLRKKPFKSRRNLSKS